MRSSNPTMKVFEDREGGKPGWAAPDGVTTMTTGVDTGRTMTIDGVIQKSALLLALMLAGAIFGWSQVDYVIEGRTISAETPMWLLPALLGGFAVAVLTRFKPHLAVVTGPIYAVVEGALLGAISKIYDLQYEGIALQAVGLTAAVFLAMLFAYSSRAIRVTDKFRRGMFLAVGGIMIYYLVALGASFFGAEMPLIWDSGPLGIGFSLVVTAIAAMTLLLDFDMIETGVRQGFDKRYEWYGGFALIASLAWLYLEILRLLSKLRNN